ncbi:ABC transporter permease [Saccharothrix sp.]|uniref:ABC transporter permease n=1 Tax=Saccharothrix sp. TaxID=1873460 RepID=UPI002811D0F3|nr:ABC transporter permease [Saccharothrix sp.]
MTSAYPTTVDTLETKVRNWAAELGHLPSRNQVMKRFKVGAPKATAVLTAIKNAEHRQEVADFYTARAKVSDDALRRLHAVPADHATTDAPTTADTTPADTTPPATTTEPAVPDAVERPADGGDGSAPDAAFFGQAGRNPAGGEASRDGQEAAGEPSRVGRSRVASWPLLLLALPAFVAVWGGWVGLGELTGFGPVRLLPGIADDFVINSAITLPIGVEAYAAYALRVWLSGATRSTAARRFARWSAIGSLVLGALGQVAYHLMEAAGVTVAPWWITTFVSVLPVVVLGCGAALTHLLHHDRTENRG